MIEFEVLSHQLPGGTGEHQSNFSKYRQAFLRRN
jgi:hypothetical protein